MQTLSTGTSNLLRLRAQVFRMVPAFSLSVCSLLLASCSHAQTSNGVAGDAPKKPLLSPAAVANVTLAGQTLSLKYNQPSLRHRELSTVVPYDRVWRTGANPATTLTTPISLHIGTLLVPAGTYTIYSLPAKEKWMLIVNKQTGQWGTVYQQDQDLGRTEMKGGTNPTSQEVMTLSFEDVKKDSAELHIRWGATDESVKISTP